VGSASSRVLSPGQAAIPGTRYGVTALYLEGPDPERLRAQVVQRFIENYRTLAGLTDAQFARFQESVRRQWEARRMLEQRKREIVQALGGQLRPGVAADQDSVTALLDALVTVRTQQIDRLRAEQAEYQEYLYPGPARPAGDVVRAPGAADRGDHPSAHGGPAAAAPGLTARPRSGALCRVTPMPSCTLVSSGAD